MDLIKDMNWIKIETTDGKIRLVNLETITSLEEYFDGVQIHTMKESDVIRAKGDIDSFDKVIGGFSMINHSNGEEKGHWVAFPPLFSVNTAQKV